MMCFMQERTHYSAQHQCFPLDLWPMVRQILGCHRLGECEASYCGTEERREGRVGNVSSRIQVNLKKKNKEKKKVSVL